MCLNGRYLEHGIDHLHGFGRERWRGQPDAIVKIDPALGDVGVLLEPTTIVAKAWEQIERIGPRAFWAPKVAAITGAGPVGLLAAMISVQHGYETHVFDRVTDGPKPGLVADLGARLPLRAAGRVRARARHRRRVHRRAVGRGRRAARCWPATASPA